MSESDRLADLDGFVATTLHAQVLRGGPSILDRRAAFEAILKRLEDELIEAYGLVSKSGDGADRSISLNWIAQQKIGACLSDCRLVISYLRDLTATQDTQEVKLDLKWRRKPRKWEERKNKLYRHNRLARIVERLNRGDWQKSAAVNYVAEKKQVNEQRIWEALDRRAHARQIMPDASERLIRLILDWVD